MDSFNTPLVLSGPFRVPRQMLANQEYGGHVSIHDDKMAESLGFSGGPIEGPTHFSQFVPLLAHLWGKRWFEQGCISAHYKNMVVEGEDVKAFVSVPKEGAQQVSIWAEKSDGTQVLTGTASVGVESGDSELDRRRAKLRPAEKLIILRDLKVGDQGATIERVRMDPDQNLGALYPFSLNEKLAVITENSPWYSDAEASPWSRPIIPLEMVCTLCQYTGRQAEFKVREPCVGLFADLEIGMIRGPLFVGQDYDLKREVVEISESRRTEGYWVRTSVLDCESGEQVAYCLLHQAIVKDSFPGYAEELASN